MKRLLFFVFTVLLVYGGCKTDLDLLDHYEQHMVAYALLDPHDTAQYVRISKVFLGEGSALEMAQQPDSIGFTPGSLEVRIERWLNGQQMAVYSLVPDTTIPRDDGIFYAPWQVLYRGAFPVYQDGSSYRLSVKDLSSGMEVHSETKIVGNIVMIDPYSNFAPLNLYDTTQIRFKFKTGTNGLRYHFKIRVHYTDQFIFDTTQVSEEFFDWDLGETNALSDAGGEALYFGFQRSNFLHTLAANIPVKPYTQRISGNLDLIYVGAAGDLVTYIDVQKANATTSADIPPYTNIEGGYGVFSSRTTNVLGGYWLDQDTRYAIRTSTITQQLNFIR